MSGSHCYGHHCTKTRLLVHPDNRQASSHPAVQSPSSWHVYIISKPMLPETSCLGLSLIIFYDHQLKSMCGVLGHENNSHSSSSNNLFPSAHVYVYQIVLYSTNICNTWYYGMQLLSRQITFTFLNILI